MASSNVKLFMLCTQNKHTKRNRQLSQQTHFLQEGPSPSMQGIGLQAPCQTGKDVIGLGATVHQNSGPASYELKT